MITWAEYAAWRRTKCPAPASDDADEQVHALLEFLGEVAELGLLLLERGIGGPDSRSRDKAIDECGDVYFCGCWFLDAIGSCVLDGYPKLAFVDEEDRLLTYQGFYGRLNRELAEAFCGAGLLANRMKKRRYHGVDLDMSVDASGVIGVFVALDTLLWRLGSSVEESLKTNQDKLNRRYPDGWTSGGGIREKLQ